LLLTGDFTNYWAKGHFGKVAGEMAILQQLSGSAVLPTRILFPAG